MSLASFWARKHRREKIRSEEPIENFLFSFAGCPAFAFFFRLRFSAVLVRRLGARVVTCLGLPGPAAGGCASGVAWPLGVVHVWASLPRLMWWLSLRMLSI